VRSHSPTNSLSTKDTFGWAVQILLDHYRDAEAADNAPCESALNLGIASAGIQEFGVANGLFQAAFDCLTDERKAIVAVHWADTMIRTGRGPKALALLEQAAQESPEHFDTRWAIARTLAQLGRPSEAREHYDALLALEDIAPDAKTRLQTERDALPQQ
ncbi:MAG: tetratricopeptide repeat protein, partial [Candidatus Hydrogenedentes bacterium]|nr:tetratricopeptide repeat protein [Candidatus Hydrogenedentota bacterium]